MARATAPDNHPRRLRRRLHDDSRLRHAHSPRQVERNACGSAFAGRPRGGRGHGDSSRASDAARFGCSSAVGDAHSHPGGLRRRGAARRVRFSASARRSLVRPPGVRRLARLQPHSGRGFLGAAHGVPHRELRSRCQGGQRGSRNPTGLLAQAARDRLPRRAGNAERERHRDAAVRGRGHTPRHDISAFHYRPDKLHRGRGAARGLTSRGHCSLGWPSCPRWSPFSPPYPSP